MRDDFLRPTIDILSKRVAFRCSNPMCKQQTIGPHSESSKTISIGVAAHITAAAPGGPRYDAALTREQRLDIGNGIWLCQTCSRLIDMDAIKYTVDLLHQWKAEAEAEASRALECRDFSGLPVADQKRPYADGELIWTGASKRPDGLSPKTVEVYGDQPISIVQAIWYNRISWNYDLKIYNNSSVGLFNLKISKELSMPAFRLKNTLSKTNNLPPYENLVLGAETSRFFEGTGEEAVAIMDQNFPEQIQGMQLLLEYSGENRETYYTRFILKDSDLEIIHLDSKP